MSFDDLSNLCKHKFFEEFKDHLPSDQKKCLDLIVYGQDILYIWDSLDKYVRTINIKHFLRDSDLHRPLILQPLHDVPFTPDRIFLNDSSSFLALVSSSEDASGVTVLELPERWTTDCDKIRIPCRNLGERLFLGEQLVLRQAKWHPASPSDSHLLILTSDECLRLFCATTGDILWKSFLSKSTNRSLLTSLPSKMSLGDSPVDFDIGPPSSDDNSPNVKWPVLILWGNGDLYCIESSIEDNREKIPAYGPLRMFPSSDDNYGSDACSILILQTTPPIVAFSTSVGTIYNCIMLPADDQQNSNEKSLFVVECIELELGITLGEEDDVISSPIRLMRNPIEKSMYFTIHKAGIHSVMLPLVTKLYEFLESNETVFPPYNHKSFVEYLLCTGYYKSSSLESLPILGCAFIDLSSSLLILLNSKEMINIRIVPHILHSLQDLEAKINQNKDEDGFLLQIQTMLKEHGPGPLIRLPESEPQEVFFNLIYNLKSQYKNTMDAHEIVAKKLKEKSNSLMAVFQEQEKQVKGISNEQEELYKQALKLSERYVELSQKQMSLMCRIENILRNVCSDSKLSERERNALDYLDSVQRRIEIFHKEIKKIETANNHQGNMVGERMETMTKRGIDLGDTRGRTMRKQLHNLTLEITLLMKRIKAIEGSVPDLMFRYPYPTIQYN